jgi:hypothetical protein
LNEVNLIVCVAALTRRRWISPRSNPCYALRRAISAARKEVEQHAAFSRRALRPSFAGTTAKKASGPISSDGAGGGTASISIMPDNRIQDGETPTDA